MVNGGLLIIRFGWRCLQEDPTLDIIDVLLAQQNGLERMVSAGLSSLSNVYVPLEYIYEASLGL